MHTHHRRMTHVYNCKPDIHASHGTIWLVSKYSPEEEICLFLERDDLHRMIAALYAAYEGDTNSVPMEATDGADVDA